jgi:hypothetical protein
MEDNNRKLELEICRIRTENDVIRCGLVTQQSSPGSVNEDGVPLISRSGKGILLKDCLTVYGGWYCSDAG